MGSADAWGRKLEFLGELGREGIDVADDAFAPSLKSLNGCQGAVCLDLQQGPWLEWMRNFIAAKEDAWDSKHGTDAIDTSVRKRNSHTGSCGNDGLTVGACCPTCGLPCSS